MVQLIDTLPNISEMQIHSRSNKGFFFEGDAWFGELVYCDSDWMNTISHSPIYLFHLLILFHNCLYFVWVTICVTASSRNFFEFCEDVLFQLILYEPLQIWFCKWPVIIINIRYKYSLEILHNINGIRQYRIFWVLQKLKFWR